MAQTTSAGHKSFLGNPALVPQREFKAQMMDEQYGRHIFILRGQVDFSFMWGVQHGQSSHFQFRKRNSNYTWLNIKVSWH